LKSSASFRTYWLGQAVSNVGAAAALFTEVRRQR
jgi:hypothetical protein